MQTQRGEEAKSRDYVSSKDLSEVDSLKLENIRLMTRIAELEQIVKEKNALETELKQIIEENAEKAKLRDAELNARIMELERSAKENEKRFAKLEQKQNNNVDRLENGDNSSKNNVNIPDLVIKSLEDNTPASDITDDDLSLSSDNNSSEQSNSLYNVKTVTLETNSTEVSEEETKPRIYDSLNLNISEISSESKSPTNLLPNQKIPYNQKVERGLRLELFICTKDNNHKNNKVFDIQIPEFSLEAILTGSVNDVKTANNIDDQSARTIVYNEIKSLLPDITDVNLRKITSRAKKAYILYEGIGIDKISQITYSASAISSLKDNQIQNIINDFPKTTDMSCQKVIGVTNCHAHMSDLSSSNDSSAELALSKLPEIEVSEEAKKTLLETEAIHDHTYFRNKILWSYSDLYKEFSSAKFDYYGIHEGSLCLVCKHSHEEGKSVKGRYEAGSYFIK
ncbi:3175_t:CDS:2, partial [Racocetra fulgida]